MEPINYLAQKNDFLQGVLDSIQDGIFVINKDMDIVYSNMALKKRYSHAIPLTGKKCYGVFLDCETPCKQCPVLATIEISDNLIGEKPLSDTKSKGGCFNVHAFPMKKRNGNNHHVIVYINDNLDHTSSASAVNSIDESKREAEFLMSKFLTLVTHDLKTPLAIMINSLRLLRDNLKKGKKIIMEEEEMITAVALNSGENMLKLVDGLLNLTRLKSGSLKPFCKFHDAYFIGFSLFEDFKFLAEDKGIKIINDIPKNSRIYADKTLLHQVLSNMLSNAIKFCSRNDEIRIFIPEDDPSTIAVRDTGPGIENGILPNLFEYGNARSTYGTNGEEGTGVGLPLCKEMIKAHGGNITVESKTNEGCTFYVKLPHRVPKVLLVDDDYDLRFVQGVHLMSAGVEVIEAKTGKEAMSLIEFENPDLIITDLMMPEMDGMQFISHVKNNPLLRSIPIIVATMKSDHESRSLAMQKGVDDFVIKPINVEDFACRIKKFIG